MRARKIRRAIITGATGMLGATLSRLLLTKEIEVVALIRPGSKKRGNLPAEAPGLTVLECDMKAVPEAALPDADAWFDFAWNAPAGPGRNDEALQAENVRCLLEALKKAKACGCNVFLGAGSQAEYGRVEGVLREDLPLCPENAYGKAKKQAEEESRALALELGLDHVWARILSVYGPYDNSYTMITGSILSLLKKERPTFTKGAQIWDYLYSEDAAEALFALAKKGVSGEAYVLGSGEARPLSEYIEMLRDAVDPGAPIGLGERPYAEGQVMHLTADITKIRRDTGWKPRVPFSTGIAKTAEYLRRGQEE